MLEAERTIPSRRRANCVAGTIVTAEDLHVDNLSTQALMVKRDSLCFDPIHSLFFP